MARDYKDEYKKFQSSKKMKKYRAELNAYNRKKGNYGNGDNEDASHKDGKITGYENQSTNRGRKDTMKKKYKEGGKVKKGGQKKALSAGKRFDKRWKEEYGDPMEDRRRAAMEKAKLAAKKAGKSLLKPKPKYKKGDLVKGETGMEVLRRLKRQYPGAPEGALEGHPEVRKASPNLMAPKKPIRTGPKQSLKRKNRQSAKKGGYIKPSYKKGGKVDKDIKFKGGRKKVTPLSQESLPGKIRRKMGPDGPVGLVKDIRGKEQRWVESAPPGKRRYGDLPEHDKFYSKHARAEKKEFADDTRYGESVRETFNPGFRTYLEEKHDTLVAPAKERMMSELRQRTAPSRKQGGEIPKMTNEGEVKQSSRLDRIRETLQKIIAVDRQTDRDLNPFYKNPKSDEEILASRKYGGPVVKNAGEPVAVYQASNSNYKEGE